MSLGKRLINTGAAAAAACTTDSTDPFGDSSGVALYNLDYDASTAPDGTDYSGTPTDVTFGVGGQINYGARFNGSSSNIDTNLKTQNVGSHSFWFKADANPSGTEVILASGYGSSNKGVNILLNTSGQIRLQINDGGGAPNALDITTSSSYADGNYHNIVATWDLTSSGTNSYLYVDNDSEVVSGSGLTSGWTSGDSTYDIFIGAYYNDSQNFDGDIDQVRIFNKALNSTEVSTLYLETACVYTSTTDIVNYPAGTTPVAYYKLDNSSEDFSTGGNDGTDTNIEYRFGRFGQAAVFNGTNGKISTPITSSDIGTSFTISCWVNVDAASDNYHVPIGNYSLSGGWYMAMFNNMKFNFYSSVGGIDFSTTATYEYGNWYHFCVVFTNNSDLKVFINGDKETNSQSVAAGTSTAGIQIGVIGSYSSSTNTEFDGKIDQVRIYDTALTDSQVTELYNEKPEVDTSNFKAVLYEGNSPYVSNVGFQPDLLWVKGRTFASNNRLFDSVRGASAGSLKANGTDAEATASGQRITSFEANGFIAPSEAGDINQSSQDFVAWVWKGGGDAVAGSGTATNVQVSANTEAGFSIVTMDADAGVRTVSHGLSQAPELIIWKSRTSSGNYWQVLAQAANGGNGHLGRLALQRSDAFLAVSSVWNNTQPTDSVFTLGTSCPDKGVAYCFHSVSGYSKIGTYTGATSGVTENIGFEPSMVIIKNITQSDPWGIFDNKRPSGTGNRSYLYPSTADDEDVYSGSLSGLTLTSTGFAIDNTNSHMVNQNGETYLYMAFK